MNNKRQDRSTITEQICDICGENKPIDKYEFRKNRPNPRKTCQACRSLIRKSDVVKMERDKKRHCEYMKQQRLVRPEHLRKIMNNFRYGVKDWVSLARGQDFKCAICESELDMGKNTHIDHDHNTGKTRGVLCHSCNIGIGFFKDNVENICKAATYLTKHDFELIENE